ncbi:MFS transporter [Corynebacterium sp. CNJ-954]|nr:MFS transporter [Corynebacterium sp. CNJ-954]
MFTPMLFVYSSALNDTQTSVIFGAYALGLFPSLLAGPQLSDRLGRRSLMFAVAAVSVFGSTALILAGDSLFGLIAGRILVGMAAGAAFGPGTVWLNELSERYGSGRSTAVLTSVALTSGFAFGPLVTGALAQWLPLPSVMPYLVHIILVLIVTPLIRATPETAPARGATRELTAEVFTTLRSRTFLFLILPTAPWVFASVSAAIVVLPQSVSFGHTQALGSGALAALTLMTGVAVQPVARRATARRLDVPTAFGLILLSVGLLVGGATIVTEAPLLLVLSALMLGAAYGFLLTTGLQAVQRIAKKPSRPLVTGIFYVLAYTGYTWPILTNSLSSTIPKTTTFVASAAICAATLLPVLLGRYGSKAQSPKPGP